MDLIKLNTRLRLGLLAILIFFSSESTFKFRLAGTCRNLRGAVWNFKVKSSDSVFTPTSVVVAFDCATVTFFAGYKPHKQSRLAEMFIVVDVLHLGSFSLFS